jgi:hypothetical protein
MIFLKPSSREEDEEAFGSLAEHTPISANTVYSILKAKVEGLSRFIVCPTQYQGRKTTDSHMRLLEKLWMATYLIMWTRTPGRVFGEALASGFHCLPKRPSKTNHFTGTTTL